MKSIEPNAAREREPESNAHENVNIKGQDDLLSSARGRLANRMMIEERAKGLMG